MDGHIMCCGTIGSCQSDRKALLVTSLTHVSDAITSIQTFLLYLSQCMQHKKVQLKIRNFITDLTPHPAPYNMLHCKSSTLQLTLLLLFYHDRKLHFASHDLPHSVQQCVMTSTPFTHTWTTQLSTSVSSDLKVLYKSVIIIIIIIIINTVHLLTKQPSLPISAPSFHFPGNYGPLHSTAQDGSIAVNNLEEL